jgi:hypothetical protein
MSPSRTLSLAAAALALLPLAHGAVVGLELFSTYDCSEKAVLSAPTATAPSCFAVGSAASIKMSVGASAMVNLIGFPGTECKYGSGLVAFYDLGSLPGNICLPLNSLLATLMATGGVNVKAMRLNVLTDGDLAGIVIGSIILAALIAVVAAWKLKKGPYAPGSSWPLFTEATLAAVKARLPVGKATAASAPAPAAAKAVDDAAEPAPAAAVATAATTPGDATFVAVNPMHPAVVAEEAATTSPAAAI